MKIIELLKTTQSRVCVEDKWMVWDGDSWVVQRRKYYARTNTVLFSGRDLVLALRALKEG